MRHQGITALQASETGFSHQHDIQSDVTHLRSMVEYLTATRRMQSGQSLIDFGGNDGTAAAEYIRLTGNPAYCSELLEDRVELGRELYPDVTFLPGPMEHIDMPDASIDWGFTVQSLEHVADLTAAIKEMGRVVKRGLYAALPLEDCVNFQTGNLSHLRHTTDPMQWRRWFEDADPRFIMADWSKQFNGFGRDEDMMQPPEIVIYFALPGDPHYINPDVMRWYDDMGVTHSV